MSPEERERLASRQAELVRALAGHDDAPAGFDPARLRAAADALSRKRARSVARAWPSLAGSLHEAFEPSFAAYAAEAPRPRLGGPLADGRNFARFLSRRGRLPDAARLEALSVDLCYAARPMGLVARRGPALSIALLRHPRRLVLAVRWPSRRARRLTIPLGLPPPWPAVALGGDREFIRSSRVDCSAIDQAAVPRAASTDESRRGPVRRGDRRTGRCPGPCKSSSR